jgi:hypothetical protein
MSFGFFPEHTKKISDTCIKCGKKRQRRSFDNLCKTCYQKIKDRQSLDSYKGLDMPTYGTKKKMREDGQK